jgi:phosphoribosylformylglycinamidine synthase
MVYRLYVEKKQEYDVLTDKIRADILQLLGIDLKYFRRLLRYDVEGLSGAALELAKTSIFSEPPVDVIYENEQSFEGKRVLVVEYLDGQFDQRADSAEQCVQLLTAGVRPLVRCATVYLFDGISEGDFSRIKKHLINPVDSKEGSAELPKTLKRAASAPKAMRCEVQGFVDLDKQGLEKYYRDFGFAMSFDDISFVQDYFKSERRNPTLTELKVIDTYWSDHCRHTTFLTEIKDIKIESDNPEIQKSLELYRQKFNELYADKPQKYPCLMDIATIAAKVLRREGYLKNLDISDEINACSVVVSVDNGGENEDWLIMFINETHNHPTEIEPFGGAATCLGGAIRDPLSGRAYVYQAMRVTGSGNPLEDNAKTLKGKLPQRVLTKTALAGFSSYGNQIGLATGIVREIYHDRFKAKRLETGYVIGGAPKKNVVRKTPKAGDIIILVGGDTGRDGCGGATGSSKAHTEQSVGVCGAEVQKGNAPEERKLQRLFKNPEAAKMIIRCNDFGAGGVSVAVGELADSLDIHLERVSKKYEGLDATELAISESQERMAVVVEAADLKAFLELAARENLKAAAIAEVTSSGRMRMFYGDDVIVDIKREFLATNGVKQCQEIVVRQKFEDYFAQLDKETEEFISQNKFEDALCLELSRLENCSQKGLGEVFDGTIGAASVLMPFGGKHALTPATVMAAKPPVDKFTHTVTCSSYGICTPLLVASPYLGAVYSIIEAVSKLVASGAAYDSIYLSLQEYFKRLGTDAQRWGEPLSAMLGAMDAQLGLKIGAIGGKDSMSGTFENLDVPPTLIAFGMGVTDDKTIIHNAFGESGQIYWYRVPKNEHKKPDYDKLKKVYGEVESLIKSGAAINSAVCQSGFMVALAKSLLGNDCGANLLKITREMFLPAVGDIILVTKEKLCDTLGEYVGQTSGGGKITAQAQNGEKVSLDIERLKDAFCSTLEPVFPTTARADGEAQNAAYLSQKKYKAQIKIARPRVLIPVFPGTNCEFDTARAFELAGAAADIFVIKNQTAKDIEETIDALAKRMENAQILAFPGGFSGGDEPDGSGKFIATTFRNPRLSECVERLLYERDGLALGICNGFQALIKLGLLPFGRIVSQKQDSATLTFNKIARHVSTICQVRVASNNSPWLFSFTVGDVFSVPVSHGEGRFVCSDQTLSVLTQNGQIATQYADAIGNATMLSPYNPNGSVNAIEGIISPCGRVLGKMGHTERYQKGLYQNLSCNFEMSIFENGVKYFA